MKMKYFRPEHQFYPQYPYLQPLSTWTMLQIILLSVFVQQWVGQRGNCNTLHFKWNLISWHFLKSGIIDVICLQMSTCMLYHFNYSFNTNLDQLCSVQSFRISRIWSHLSPLQITHDVSSEFVGLNLPRVWEKFSYMSLADQVENILTEHLENLNCSIF